ncbi:XRE family transcriptional regulator [Listeria monocytogenes]|uniref:XRE family transcriptional regulator n=1 Tax=Listeria monocytogenes serotype 1/2a TaxID=1906951 RepID=A0A9P1YNZ3_LISMN|nr:helix-turn-helix transcriptional regulator [Listeria monocytogenes]EAF3075370.1 XRE family transcriptional regulator [Listeria monocytogenes serotype 1/2a]EAC3781819.1 XRE family transcriptional regulator [Listeria monocytogenes]EAC8452585.1 XRE family transcriptional regulator [Listeria monocytogenes]EAC8514307.1 XRE family transcriptional regulator [Listeria monocytogenes]EAC9604166.1 XRE family transcriptional regulator [Listeria monocytogenes]
MSRHLTINLKRLVANRNISLRELARRSDIEPSIINKLANNKHERIYLRHIERIADALEVDCIEEILIIENKDDWRDDE